jgi:hypothetical protein
MTIFDQIKADREAGTDGDWSSPDKYPSEVEAPCGQTIASCWHEHAVGRTVTLEDVYPCSLSESNANASRIARVPQLERIALAAEEMANSLSTLRDEVRMRGGLPRYEAGQAADKAIAAFREACK